MRLVEGIKRLVSLSAFLLVFFPSVAQNASEIVEKAYEKMRGETSYAEMEMKIIRPAWERTIKFRSWAMGTEFSMALITHPAREEGKAFLKQGDNMWSWRPAINRMIKLPPSMMSQGWMGSDYTNDDLINEASVVDEYRHKILGSDTVRGRACHMIRLTPKKEAAVVWGKIHMWISKEEYYELKAKFFDEEGELIKTHLASEIREMGNRTIPTKFEIIPEDEENQRTVVYLREMDFGINLDRNFFSKQNMKKLH